MIRIALSTTLIAVAAVTLSACSGGSATTTTTVTSNTSAEQPGTAVEVLPKLGCTDPGFVRPEDVPMVYEAAVGTAPTLSGVYAPASGTAKWDEEYIAVLTTGTHDGGASAGTALHIHNGRIVAIEDDCGDLLRLLDASRTASWVLEPGAVADPHHSDTGVGTLDQVLNAALAPDPIEMARLTGYANVACAAEADADHPACRG